MGQKCHQGSKMEPLEEYIPLNLIDALYSTTFHDQIPITHSMNRSYFTCIALDCEMTSNANLI